MYILGISALYHDSAAAIICNGEIIAAAQEERFTRIKHDLSIPINAVKYCLDEANLCIDDIDVVVYYDNPILTLDRIVCSLLSLKGDSETLLEKELNDFFEKKVWINKTIENKLGGLGKLNKLLVVKHHLSHAASAFYPSPYDNAVILTIDGVGEWETTTISVGNKNKIEMKEVINYPHSLGLFYSAFTYFCGFKVNSGDYKFMGLAPYGRPVYYDLIMKEIISVKEDGSFELNMKYFEFHKGLVMTNDNFAELFGGPKREMESLITQREMDIAASAQKVIEEILIKIVNYSKKTYGQDINNLVIAGGVALNCVANGKISNENIYDNIWIQPAAGDAGGALGAALYVYYDYYGNERISNNTDDQQKGSYLGKGFSNSEIEKYLVENKYPYLYYENKDIHKEISRLLQQNKIIGLFHGRMEFGPRALGNRSIIADPRTRDMQSKLNLKIKYRESFRPFAPIVLKEFASEYFEIEKESPYMLFVQKVVKNRRIQFDLREQLLQSNDDMLKVINAPRSDIPAVTHVDYSARIQTVDSKRNEFLYDLLLQYQKDTGCSVLVNTSFNVRGEPIVCTPEDAYRCFMRTEMDVLVLNNFILLKENQPFFCEDKDWRKMYELD